jgi:sugar transferase (PEP-CTERM system associated)
LKSKSHETPDRPNQQSQQENEKGKTVATDQGALWNRDMKQGTAQQPRETFKLLNRSYGTTLVRIGAHHVPRRSLILAASESFLIMLALVVATFFRFVNASVALDYLSHPTNWLRFGLVTAVCQLSLYYNDLYDNRAVGSRGLRLVRAFAAMGIALLVLSLLYYWIPSIRLERGIALIAAAVAVPTLMGWRLSLDKSKVFSHPLERILVLGTGRSGINLAAEILRRPELQYKVVGFLDERGGGETRLFVTPGIIGAVAEVDEVAAREEIDRIVISLGERRGVMPIRQLANLKLQGMPIEDCLSLYERLTGRISLEQLQPSWLIMGDGFRKSQVVRAAKRLNDILFSTLAIILASPLMLAVALAILLEDGAPAIFRQERVGLGGKSFKVIKFRSMRKGSEKAAPSWTADGDPRITRVGAFIRKYRLDELPQLFNILRGEMSVVGPRPEVPYFCELLDKEIPFFNQRHSVRPGLTGWAQVKYQYGATLEQAKTKFEYDLFYIKHLSFMFDLTIILETVKVVLTGRGGK